MRGRREQTTLQPTVLRWARERAGLAMETVATKVGARPDRVVEWEQSGRISLSQVDRLAHCTHTPLGSFYLCERPDGALPIPDLRRAGGESRRRPGPDSLETVDLMARRQAWMRDELIEDCADPLAFVCCCGRDATPAEAAVTMREHQQTASRPDGTTGSNFWTSQNVRKGRRFRAAVSHASSKAACRIAKRTPSRVCAVTRSTPSCTHWVRRRERSGW